MDIGFVCILDVLGVKGIYKRMDPKAFINTMKEIERFITRLQQNNAISYETEFISDTMIFTSFPKKQLTDRNNYIEFLRNMTLFAELISSVVAVGVTFKIPFRGAMSCNKLIKDGHYIVGPAIDIAAMEYEKTDWIGVHSAPDLNLMIKENINVLMLEKDRFSFIEYDVPFKEKIEKRYSINWLKPLIKIGNGYSPKDFVHLNLSELQNLDPQNVNNGKIRIKYDNTRSYIDYCLLNT